MVQEKEIKRAVDVLRAGGVVATPSVSSYGLSADAANTRAVSRVFVIKGRSAEKTPILLVSSLAMAERIGVFSPRLRALARTHWPGALTLVVPAKRGSGLSRAVIREDQTIAVRFTPRQDVQSVIRRLGGPITSTSANRAGEPPAYSVQQIRARLRLQPDFILDAGTLPTRPPSTLVREAEGEIEILRQGAVHV